jgi:hypothetical protein
MCTKLSKINRFGFDEAFTVLNISIMVFRGFNPVQFDLRMIAIV